MRRLAALLLSIALVGAACGDSAADNESSAATTTTVASVAGEPNDDLATLKAELGSSGSFSGSPTDDEVACIGSNIVTELGEGRLAELGVTAANAFEFDPAFLPGMTDAERDALVDIADGCLDLRAQIADEFGAGDVALAACAYEAFSRDDARGIIRAGMNPDEDAGFDALVDLYGNADACVLGEEPASTGDPGEEPASTGDDAQALADAFAASTDDGTTTEAESQCFGDSIVAAIGIDRFTELGVTPANVDEFSINESGLTDAELDSYIDVFANCSDLRQFLLDWFLGEFTDAACVAETLTDDDAWRWLRYFISPEGAGAAGLEAPPDVQAKLDACPV